MLESPLAVGFKMEGGQDNAKVYAALHLANQFFISADECQLLVPSQGQFIVFNRYEFNEWITDGDLKPIDPIRFYELINLRHLYMVCRDFLMEVTVYPVVNDITRRSDMGSDYLRAGVDGDGDSLLEIRQGGNVCMVEFCTSQGGGKSPNTRQAVRRLAYFMSVDHQLDESGRVKYGLDPKNTPKLYG